MLVVSAKIKRDQQPVNDVVISIDHTSGNFFITEKDIQEAVMQLLPDSGAMLHTKDLKELESKLKEIPQVRTSNVFVNNTGQLSIEVHQRQPLYRVIRADGKSYYVDEDGYKFPVSGKYTARVGLATGYIADDGKLSGLIATDMNRNLMDVFTTLKRDPFWAAQFGQVEVSAKGELTLIPRMGNHVVLLGSPENLEEKLQRLRIFYHEALPKAGWDTYKIINVKYKDQVVCTK
jgi:cell division protein FtsQ